MWRLPGLMALSTLWNLHKSCQCNGLYISEAMSARDTPALPTQRESSLKCTSSHGPVLESVPRVCDVLFWQEGPARPLLIHQTVYMPGASNGVSLNRWPRHRGSKAQTFKDRLCWGHLKRFCSSKR
uniref:Secreted protein n=1 Tax=Rousettus aegyptiacus TaxID=9407 RepID=A0A7J8DHK8_ROUAE|nr:hypothetical protein HJG63_008527 [Rousettus aegyptiacus]